MAFRKDKTGAAQTAANAAATVVGAFAESFESFDDAVEAFNSLREEVFEDLAKVVDQDNELFAEVEKSNGSSSSKRSSGSSSRTKKTAGGRSGSKSKGGGRKSGGRKGFDGDLDDALDLELNFGAFEGETLATVLGTDTDTAEEDYGYGDGERDGRDYISWLAGKNNQNTYVRDAARLVADDADIEYDA